MPNHLFKTISRAMFRCGKVFAVVVLLAEAQSPVPPRKDRVINVTAMDEKGQPVVDLTSADFQIFDDGKAEPIASFKPILPMEGGEHAPPATLVLFDLLNTFAGQRENSVTLIDKALQPLETGNSIFLYLLTNHGDLFPVHALAMPQTGEPEPPWTKQVRPLLDQAIQQVNALRLKDFQDEGVGAAATFFALDEVGNAFMKIPGPKAIVWITRGAPNWLDYRYGCKDVVFSEGSGSYVGGRCGTDCTRRAGMSKCVDYTPLLQRFGGKLSRSDTVFYSVMVDPEGTIFNTDRGRPRDTLQQLADLSGGHLYFHGEIGDAIAGAMKNIRGRYQISYDPPPANGKYHKLRVECSRKGIRVDAPPGYYAESSQQN